jgi:hypothetical protein
VVYIWENIGYIHEAGEKGDKKDKRRKVQRETPAKKERIP